MRIHSCVRRSLAGLLVASSTALVAGCRSAEGPHASSTRDASSPGAEHRLLRSHQTAMNKRRSAEARAALLRLRKTEDAPWVDVMVALSYCAEGNHDAAARELSRALDRIAKDTHAADSKTVELVDELDRQDE